MKKLSPFFLFCLLLTLGACGSGEEKPEDGNGGEEPNAESNEGNGESNEGGEGEG